jgi:hypothetical protein
MATGRKVRDRKRFRDSGGRGVPGTNGRRPHNIELNLKAKETRGGQALPNYNPEFLTRQQLRRMLREKAKKDVLEQYGRANERQTRFVGYLGFSRRGRRRVIHRMAQKWYQQITTELRANNEPQRKRGFVKDIMRRVIAPFRKAERNSLAAAGITG